MPRLRAPTAQQDVADFAIGHGPVAVEVIRLFHKPRRGVAPAAAECVLAPDYDVQPRGLSDLRGTGRAETVFLEGRKG